MKTTLIILAILALWLVTGFIWNHFHPDDDQKDHYDECPYE